MGRKGSRGGGGGGGGEKEEVERGRQRRKEWKLRELERGGGGERGSDKETDILLSLITHLSKADLSIVVLIHLLDHGFESKMGLWLPQFLHHQLQLHQVYEVTAISVVPVHM